MAIADATADTAADAGPADVLALVLTAGVIATVGSILVVLGVSDFVSYLHGYRPGRVLAILYGRAFLVAVLGWTLLGWALVRVGRGVLLAR